MERKPLERVKVYKYSGIDQFGWQIERLTKCKGCFKKLIQALTKSSLARRKCQKKQNFKYFIQDTFQCLSPRL